MAGSLVSDELGVQWLVYPGDPAQQMIVTLSKAGFTVHVLPRYTLLTGELSAPNLPKLPQVPIDKMTQVIKDEIIRRVRLYDCLKYLYEVERG